MKKLAYILITIITTMLLFSNSTNIYAQTSEDFTSKHVAALKLVIPPVTDDPNYSVTFVPIKGTAIDLSIDKSEYKSINSPYQLPTLSIGKHQLDIKYLDNSEITQAFTLFISVIPREPRFDTAQKLIFKKDESVEIKGSGIPNGTLDIWFVSGSDLIMKTANVDTDGIWSLDVTESLKCGEYQVMGMIKKDGFASSMSTPKIITYCAESAIIGTIDDGIDGDSKFDVKKWFYNTLDSLENDNSVIIALVSVLFVGLFFGLLYSNIAISHMKKQTKKMIVGGMRSDKEEKDELISNKLKNHKIEDEKEPEELKEEETEVVEVEEKEVDLTKSISEELDKNPVKTEKTKLSRDEFLKRFQKLQKNKTKSSRVSLVEEK